MAGANIKELEDKLWKSAEALRGNLSAEDYMHVVLGILSLKYISDQAKLGYKKMQEEGLTIDEIGGPDEFYYDYNAFVVSENDSWDYIIKYANSSLIGEKLDDAFIQLEKDNPMLKGIFDKNYNREGLDQIRLGEVVRTFADEDFSEGADEDIIGRVYEYFLGKFFKDRGQKGGEFYTPDSIVKLMVNILKPTSGTIYDPACGTGGMLVQAKRYIEENNGNVDAITVYGQEFNNTTWKLAKLNLILNGFSLEDPDGKPVLGENSADTFTDDQHRDKHFDYVLANPPFNMKNWGYDQLIDDSRWKWGVPPKGNANYAWIEQMLSKLTSKGKAAIVLANGSLSSSQKNEVEIRKNLIKDNIVEGIIELPDKLFYTTGIPACIWIFNKNKVTKDTLMISSSKIEGKMLSKKLRELTPADIKKIVELFNKHFSGEEINEVGFAKTVSVDELETNNYSFVPERYVGLVENKIDEKKVKEEINVLSKELYTLLNQFDEMVPRVKKAINEALNYENDKNKK